MINWEDWKTYLFILLPSITGYLASFFCYIGKDAGSKIPSRPPSWIFGVVWPILYIFLGLTWVILRKNSYIIDILMIINIFGLILWIIVYGCQKNKKLGLYVLLFILVIAFMIFGYAWSQNKIAAMLTTPFLVWIIFATMLNYTEVNKTMLYET